MTSIVTTSINVATTAELNYFIQQLTEKEPTFLKQLTEFQFDQTECEKLIKEFYSALMKQHCEQIAHLKTLQADLAAECERIRDWITTHKQLLGQYTSGTPSRDPNKSLRENLKQLRAERAALEKEYFEREKQVKDLKDHLLKYGRALRVGSVIDELIESVGSDVSVAAINILEDEKKQYQTKYEERLEVTQLITTTLLNLLKTVAPPARNPLDDKASSIYSTNGSALQHQTTVYLLTKDEQIEMERRVKELQGIKEQHTERIKHIRKQLEHIMSRIGVAEEEFRNVMQKVSQGCTYGDVQTAEDLLQKYIELKKEKLGEFIENAKKALHEAWDSIFYTDAQRKLFQPAFSNEVSEEVLEAIEAQTKSVQQEFQNYHVIYNLVRKHRRLLKEYAEFEATTKDKTRLLKTKGDPGRLLREERTRKRFTHDIPKVESELQSILLEYEALHGKYFYIGETPYLREVLYATTAAATSCSRKRNRDKEGEVARNHKKQKPLP